jgi:C-terminal processing protease CtpA/Prc
VVEGGPAYVAGVRNGDVLLQVDELKVTSSNYGWENRFRMPAGTTLKLTLIRNGKTVRRKAILREILQPSFSKRK